MEAARNASGIYSFGRVVNRLVLVGQTRNVTGNDVDPGNIRRRLTGDLAPVIRPSVGGGR